MRSRPILPLLFVWVSFILYVSVLVEQSPYLSYKVSHFALFSNYNVSSHLLLGSLVWYYSLFLQTLIMYRVKFPSLAFCDFVVGTLSGLAIIYTQHDFGKNTRSTSWSEKDRQHTFLGVVLLVVGICNAMDMLCFGDAFSDCLDKYVFRSVEGKSLTIFFRSFGNIMFIFL